MMSDFNAVDDQMDGSNGSKCVYICTKTVKFISLNIKYLVFVVYSIEFKLGNRCILFLFTFYKTSHLHWNWGLKIVLVPSAL